MNAREALWRYLRQRLEAGESEIFLDGLSAAEALALLQPAALSGADGGGVDRGRGAGIGTEVGTGPGTEVGAAPAGESAPAGGGARAGGAGKLLQALAEHAPGVMGERVAASSAQGGAQPPRDSGALRILGQEVAGCTACRLHEGRNQVVFGEGNASAEVVIVGEAPGREEDRTGRPFVGPAGKLLDLLLQSAGFPRDQVYICNVLKCRPPDNRDPLQDEVEACAGHLRRQLDAIRPTVLLAVGKFAAQTLAGSEQNIGALRGAVHSYHGIPLVVSYHPAFLLRSPQWTRAAWNDLQLLREVLESKRRIVA